VAKADSYYANSGGVVNIVNWVDDTSPYESDTPYPYSYSYSYPYGAYNPKYTPTTPTTLTK
jgi:hypothetical protein